MRGYTSRGDVKGGRWQAMRGSARAGACGPVHPVGVRRGFAVPAWHQGCSFLAQVSRGGCGGCETPHLE